MFAGIVSRGIKGFLGALFDDARIVRIPSEGKIEEPGRRLEESLLEKEKKRLIRRNAGGGKKEKRSDPSRFSSSLSLSCEIEGGRMEVRRSCSKLYGKKLRSKFLILRRFEGRVSKVGDS